VTLGATFLSFEHPDAARKARQLRASSRLQRAEQTLESGRNVVRIPHLPMQVRRASPPRESLNTRPDLWSLGILVCCRVIAPSAFVASSVGLSVKLRVVVRAFRVARV
jgi:hypothetical protein